MSFSQRAFNLYMKCFLEYILVSIPSNSLKNSPLLETLIETKIFHLGEIWPFALTENAFKFLNLIRIAYATFDVCQVNPWTEPKG